MEAIKERIIKILKKVKGAITIKNVLLLILGIIIILSGAALLIWLVAKLLNFIIANFQLLFIGVIFLAAIIYSINDKRKTKERKEAIEQEAVTQQKAEFEKVSLERDYNLFKKVLFAAINETIEATHLQRISSLSQLDTPVHFEEKCGFFVYHYMIPKTTNQKPLDLIKEILRDRIGQKLSAHEVAGIKQDFYIHPPTGRTYPYIYIDNIIDCGTFLQIDIVVASLIYVNFLMQAKQIETTYSATSADKDF